MTTLTMPGVIKLEEPPTYDRNMDFETIQVWLFAVENYFVLIGLMDEICQSRFASTLLTKNAALWLRRSHLDLNTTKLSTLQHKLCSYFQPADYRHRVRDDLASLKQ